MQSIDHKLQHGWQLHQAGDVEGARRCYEEALIASPSHPEALVYLGIALFDQRQFLASIDAYRQAISIRNEFPIAWNNLGNSLRMLGEIEEAECLFAEALRQRPDYLSALKNRGTLWVWSGQIERGLHWYKQGLQIDPNHAELHRNLGVIHLLLGDYDVGWPEYRWRWRMPGLRRPRVRRSKLAGRILARQIDPDLPRTGARRHDPFHTCCFRLETTRSTRAGPVQSADVAVVHIGPRRRSVGARYRRHTTSRLPRFHDRSDGRASWANGADRLGHRAFRGWLWLPDRFRRLDRLLANLARSANQGDAQSVSIGKAIRSIMRTCIAASPWRYCDRCHRFQELI